MLYLMCEHHTSLRWLVKSLSVSSNGRYNGQRNLHFCGRILTEQEGQSEQTRLALSEPATHASVYNGQVVRECPCSADSLIVAPESRKDFFAEYPAGTIAEPLPLKIPRHMVRKALMEGIMRLLEMKNEYAGTYRVDWDEMTETEKETRVRVTVSREQETETFHVSFSK